MTNQLQVLGTQMFMGIEIPVIEGGFGENQKVILAKTVAEIHGVRVNDVQDLINQNISEFEIGVDLLDLCDESFKTDAIGLGFITSNRQKHCYLLSEQGYMALVQLMRTERAKEIRKQLRREYFSMRKELNEIAQKKSSLLRHSIKFCVKANPIRQRVACKASMIWDFLLIAWFPWAEAVCAPQA